MGRGEPARPGPPQDGADLLTLDLPLQAVAQQALECIGLRRGA